MTTVTIDGQNVEVEAGTNLVDAARQAGIEIPHYCYHPRLSVVGQCRMCLVQIEGVPKLQAGCSTHVRDGMVVNTKSGEVENAQKGVMEFLLLNHPLDCPICDQAGECSLQNYSFEHGSVDSRFDYEDKRTVPGKERVPLGPNIILNSNRCIHCTRCIRFTREITKTGELGLFNRGARAEVGVFPGKELNNDLATCVVDICPVGALTSTRFRFAERVWFLEKKPSICTGCDAGCNITIEHNRGAIKRYKPRFNPEVNDHWMCDAGRASFEIYENTPRLDQPKIRKGDGFHPISWNTAIGKLHEVLRLGREQSVFLGSGFLTCEEGWLLRTLADTLGTPHRSTWVDSGPEHRIPNAHGELVGRDAAPNRHGMELVGLIPREGGLGADQILLEDDSLDENSVLLVADSAFGKAAWDPRVVERLRKARFLAVIGWADTPLAQVADLVLPSVTPAEKCGTYVNRQHRIQRIDAAFPSRGASRPPLEIYLSLMTYFNKEWKNLNFESVFAAMAHDVVTLNTLSLSNLPPEGVSLISEEEA